MKDKDVKNKTILVTGGRVGLGEAVAKKLLEAGHTVIVTSRIFNFANITSIQQNSLISQRMDVTSESSIKQVFAWIDTLNIKIDVLINNAGVGIFKPFSEITLEEWNIMVQTNLTGAFLCCKEAYKNMKKNGGRIINIGSIVEKIPLSFNAAYAATKTGLKSLSATINEECKFDKVRVTHIILGATNTEIWKTREGFSKEDMLDPEVVANQISNIALLPLSIRIDNIEIVPEKGVL